MPADEFKPSEPGRWMAHAVPACFILCLALGTAVVTLHTRARMETARIAAAAQARATAAALEFQINQASAAAQSLAIVSRQSSGPIVNFQKAASDLLAAHPSVGSLELRPGGITSDVVPRNRGYERLLGTNVMKNPFQSREATLAYQRRVTTFSGPLFLLHDEMGVVAHAPVFIRSYDGRETFWGLTAASMSLNDAVKGANLDDLWSQGWQYALMVPQGSGREPYAITARRQSSFDKAQWQSVSAANLEFKLGLVPRGGWIPWVKVAAESAVALLISILATLVANLVSSRRAVETTLAEETRRLARANDERKLAQTTLHSAQDKAAALHEELSNTRINAQKSAAALAEARAQLETSVRAAEKVDRTRQAELEQTKASLTQAAQKIAALETRLEAAARDLAEAASQSQLLDQTRARLAEEEAKTADLLSRIQTLMDTAKKAAEASESRLAALNETNHQLNARMEELLGMLEESEAKSHYCQPVSLPEEDTLNKDETELLAELVEKQQATEPSPAPPAPAEPAQKPVAEPVVEPTEEQTPPPAPIEPPTPASEPVANQESEPETEPVPDPASKPDSEPAPAEPTATPTRRKKRRTNQMDFFAASESESEPEPEAESAVDATEPEPSPTRSRRLPQVVNLPAFRKAVSQIVPLLADGDPGAWDCLQDNQSTFESAFAPETFEDFTRFLSKKDFASALEQLKKAAKRHGVSI